MRELLPRRPVTIVVPLYDDLAGIEACLRSLVDNVDFSIDRVLVSNDAGPQRARVDALVEDLVGDHEGFQIHSNERNLGFVGNCNHAVLTLDTTGNDVLLLNSDTITTAGFVEELAAVLSLSEDHGVVTARSNNATIASLPHLLRNPHAGRSVVRSEAVWRTVSPLLPRFTVAPVAMGFCYLVRRELIDRFGFFDERFSPGYGEENDFCLRVGAEGHLSVIANHALVFHTGSTSFSGDSGPRLRFAHEKTLIERYPHYVGAQEMYFRHDRDPVDTFADTFRPGDDMIRVAVLVSSDALRQSGALVRDAAAALGPAAQITVLSTKSRSRSSGLPGAVRLSERDRHHPIYDVAVQVGAPDDYGDLLALNKLAPRWVCVVPTTQPRQGARVRGAAREALLRIVLRFAQEQVTDHSSAALAAALLASGRGPIDVDGLRLRWSSIIDADVATGRSRYPRRATLRRRSALLLASRWPRLTGFLRKLVS